MKGFFQPNTVAVVGVSETPTNLGRRIVLNMHEFSFDGIIYQVGPRGGRAFGRRIYRSVSDIPDQVDLAVILVPAEHVPGIVEECGQKGIHRLIIESAGFAEFSSDGRRLEDEIRASAHRYDIRFIGPNCIGVVNFKNGLVVPFAGLKDNFSRGNVSIITQSGGVGLSYLNVMESENLGVAKLISVGNKLDVDECDLLEFLIDDEDTAIICIYLESFSDGRRLMDIARRTSKPILLHKSSIGSLAKEIAKSHTASLSGDDKVVTAALEQVGIARFSTSLTMVNYLKILPLPKLRGNRLAVISRSGGHAVIAADACELAGFELAHFPEAFLRDIERHFRANVIRLTNPIDLGDLFDFEVYSRIVEETLKLESVDGMVFLHTYISALEGEKSQALFERIEELSFRYGKPVAVCVSTDEAEMSKVRRTVPHPVYTSPEDAIQSLALVRDFHHEPRPAQTLPDGPIDLGAILAILERAEAARRDPLLPEGLDILKAAGLSVAEAAAVESALEAAKFQARLGRPITLKLIAAEASHKSDLGGVELNLASEAEVQSAFERLRQAALRAGIQSPIRVLAQAHVSGGLELIVGGRRDPAFGPVVLVGIGGIFVEVLRDVQMRVVPIDEAEAGRMIRSLKAAPLLQGARGQSPRDIAAVQAALIAVARLLVSCPAIAEVDVNPLLVLPEGRGAIAVDARIVLAPSAPVA